ncbi:hypothetical protein MCAP1_003514 [Malassezia caprae]|uniref:Glucose-6-phosphate 1-dehydrogenase n=1 Tax=Malassezia caprae TaxID=1381934 RepID=A0AAF0E8R6_9BASI|nr:hypothetical protein MCAP1_003514 [Malassezia caprae]
MEPRQLEKETSFTFPALFRLFLHGDLPDDTLILGYARSKMKQEEFHERISSQFEGTDEQKQAFLQRCRYMAGQYDDDESFVKLNDDLTKWEDERGGEQRNRIFYFALPPSVFVSVSHHLRKSCYVEGSINRVVVEKPFGMDLESCSDMLKEMQSMWTEAETFRIDHYLGKEMVKNIIPLRFGNPFVELMLNKLMVDNVQITFKEAFGTEGRGGYFDKFGIIRDIQQNHLCQVFSLLAMEEPESFSPEAIRDAKVNLLRSVRPISADDVLLGQYVAHNGKPGYKDDETVPKDSNTPTFAAVVLHVDNDRWSDVPFIMKAGKALDEGKVEIRVQFRDLERDIRNIERNELVIRIQPGEALYFIMNTKVPGHADVTVPVELDLTYKHRFQDAYIPEAYEALILDCLRDEHSNFVRDDELEASWSIFTPILHAIDAGEVPCEPYEYGSRGPEQLNEFIGKFGYKPKKNYEWPETNVKGMCSKV